MEIIGAMTFSSPIAMNPAAMIKVKKYPFLGSFERPYPLAKISMPGKILSLETAWKTFGALTREARADDNVAAKIPINTNGPHNEILSMI